MQGICKRAAKAESIRKKKKKVGDQETEGHMHVNVRCPSEVEFKS